MDGNQRYSWTKKKRSPLVSRTLPRLFRCNTISCCRSVAISASSRAFDLNGETKMARTNQRSPITRSAYAIRSPSQRDEVFGTHSTSKFAFVQLVEKANRVTASAFLVALVEAVPYKIHTVLTDNGIQFRLPPRHANGPTARYTTHMFDLRCREHGIEHRFTKINHPWTNGQVERMNRTIKDATVKRYHYDDHNQLRRHLADFVDAYNFGRRLKTLKGLTPFEFISKCWTSDPQRFKLNPLQQMPGLNTYIPLRWKTEWRK